MMNGIEYLKIDDRGLHFLRDNKPDHLEVDTIIICAGQEPLRDVFDAAQARGLPVELVGGAFEAAELMPRRQFIRPVTWQRLFELQPFIKFPVGNLWFQYSIVRQARHRGAAKFRHKPATSSSRAWPCD